MKVPGLHVPQYPTDAPPQPLRRAPFGHATLLHAVHASALLAFENVPGPHLLHERSDVAVGAFAWRWPAAHKICLLQ